MGAWTKHRWLTVGFWVAWVAAVLLSSSWALALLSLLVMIVLDQCQKEE